MMLLIKKVNVQIKRRQHLPLTIVWGFDASDVPDREPSRRTVGNKTTNPNLK